MTSDTPRRFSETDIERLLKRLLSSAKQGGKRAGRDSDLTFSFLKERWSEIDGCCEVSGLPFTDELFPHAFVKHPFAPSLDQLVPGRGYNQDNVRIVCTCANFSRNEWGIDVLVRLAGAVLDHPRQSLIRNRLVVIWRARQEGRIAEALVAAERMPPESAQVYRRRIAGLRRALTLAPEGLRLAAGRARAKLQQPPHPGRSD